MSQTLFFYKTGTTFCFAASRATEQIESPIITTETIVSVTSISGQPSDGYFVHSEHINSGNRRFSHAAARGMIPWQCAHSRGLHWRRRTPAASTGGAEPTRPPLEAPNPRGLHWRRRTPAPCTGGAEPPRPPLEAPNPHAAAYK